MEINKFLHTGREALLKNGIDPREARLLLAFALNIKSEELIKYKECLKEESDKFFEFINRRCAGEPFAYITEYKEFMKLNFKVSEDVLIPREDTEILVQELINRVNLKEFKEEESIKILDMCTGSGCIAISLAKYIKNAKVTAVDISSKAISIAKENAIKNDVAVNFIESNLFENVQEQKFDIIVSNPPYIKKEVIDSLQVEVKKEPIIALDGGESGLEFYQKITSEALKYLRENGILAYEIGYDQGRDVMKIMADKGFVDIKVIKDLSMNDRVVIGKLN